MKITEKLFKLRSLMNENNIDAYIIPTSDFHNSEYVGEYFKARAYMSGFSGSAGVLYVLKEEAVLYTDGRYFIQAEKQLEGSTIELMRMGEVDEPEVYLNKKLKENETVGYDGRVLTASFIKTLKKAFGNKKINFKNDVDLVNEIWTDRPALSCEPAFLLDDTTSGKSTTDKINDVREEMKKVNATYHVLTTLDDIAWLLNMRGNDVLYNPVVLSYVMLNENETYVYLNKKVLSDEMVETFKKQHITVKNYEDIYSDVKQLKDETVLLDTTKVNDVLFKSIEENNKIVDERNPEILMKAIKNETELNHLRNAHVKDGVAVTKFMYWLKTNIGKIDMSEISVSDYLYELRKQQEGFMELSFGTISAYEDHGPMMHYSATSESDYKLEEKGFLLVDSGGQYRDGTTDITRTFVLGEVSHERKKHFTAVAKSMFALSKANFLYGCHGTTLDILARGPIWDLGIDYRCGTGHGVGFILNVHEGPQRFHWKPIELKNSSVLEEGMVITDEPGIYNEGAYGIRLENELIVHKTVNNEYGQFMNFETLTYCPIDLDGILVEELDESIRKEFNNYHKMVFEKVSPYLTEEEKEWLKVYTREI